MEWLGRLPAGWFDGPPRVSVDREGIVVVGMLPAPDAAAARFRRKVALGRTVARRMWFHESVGADHDAAAPIGMAGARHSGASGWLAGARATGPVVLPAAGEPVEFEQHIKALFRARDWQSMSFAFDLWDYDAVRGHADAILARLRDGSMPCDGTWPAERIDVVARWVEAGSPR